jgi:hypothetical protein
MTEIDGVMTHGWPGSVVELLETALDIHSRRELADALPGSDSHLVPA